MQSPKRQRIRRRFRVPPRLRTCPARKARRTSRRRRTPTSRTGGASRTSPRPPTTSTYPSGAPGKTSAAVAPVAVTTQRHRRHRRRPAGRLPPRTPPLTNLPPSEYANDDAVRRRRSPVRRPDRANPEREPSRVGTPSSGTSTSASAGTTSPRGSSARPPGPPRARRPPRLPVADGDDDSPIRIPSRSSLGRREVRRLPPTRTTRRACTARSARIAAHTGSLSAPYLKPPPTTTSTPDRIGKIGICRVRAPASLASVL